MRTCGFSWSVVGSAGTRQPAARRSQACRACVPRARRRAGCTHLRPRLGPANSLSAVRVRGRQAVVKDVGVRPSNDGQAAADDARPRPPEDATPAAVHVVRGMYVCKIPSQRLVHAPHPHLPPLRRRRRLRRLPREAVQRLTAALVRAILLHAGTARLPIYTLLLVLTTGLTQGPAFVRAFAMYSPFTRRARPATGALRRRCLACGPSWYSSLAPERERLHLAGSSPVHHGVPRRLTLGEGGKLVSALICMWTKMSAVSVILSILSCPTGRLRRGPWFPLP